MTIRSSPPLYPASDSTDMIEALKLQVLELLELELELRPLHDSGKTQKKLEQRRLRRLRACKIDAKHGARHYLHALLTLLRPKEEGEGEGEGECVGGSPCTADQQRVALAGEGGHTGPTWLSCLVRCDYRLAFYVMPGV